jgi:ABC-type nickel/cobalt efflux system permease component RcnA
MARRMTSIRRLIRTLPIMLVMVALLGQPHTATAHPLGNFSVNLYSRLVVGPELLDVVYVVDMAEIPTFQEFGQSPSEAAIDASSFAQRAEALRDGLKLSVDGTPHKLDIASQALSFPPGQGGLATTRMELRLSAPLTKLGAGAERRIAYEDTNFADRQGWHEIVVQTAAGAALAQSNAPSEDQSNELRAYPENMLTSPLNLRAASLLVVPGTGAGTAMPTTQLATTRPNDTFAALMSVEQLTPFALAMTLLAALGLGAMHALSPGHGKTVVAAYLVGARGTPRHALFLGLTVTTTHTLGVFALGFVTLYASQYILPEQLYPWLSVLSGLIVIGIGVTLLRQRIVGLRGHSHHHHDHDHDHHHDHSHDHDHDHDHDHSHDHDHDHHHHGFGHSHGPGTHTHIPPGADGTPITWRSLLALGISGGLLPCPSALVVMLSAISLGRVGFGLLLIVAFSIGLAGVLTGVGILFVHGGRWFNRLSNQRRLTRFATGIRLVPVLSALFVTTAGFVITAQALSQAGLLR